MEPLKHLNVFWLDDQHDEAPMVNFKVQAEQYGVILHPYASAEEGLPVLEERLEFFDAVLLDALFFQRKDQVSGTEEVDGLSTAIAKVNQLKHRKAFTPFILTGQERLDGDKTFKAMFGEFYSKRDPKDVQRLFKDIRLAAEAMADTQIRHRFHRVFEVCTGQYIGEDAGRKLLGILRDQGLSINAADTDTRIVAIRKILEDVFAACSRTGLVPDAFMPASTALNETGGFLAGRCVRGYQIRSGIVPPVIADLIGAILRVAQPAAHRAQVDAHLKLVGSTYLLHAVAYMLMDVLLWFKKFADNPPAGPLFEEAAQAGITEPLFVGTIERDEYGNFHCGEYSIAPGRLTGYAPGERIAVTRASENTNDRNRRLYPKFAQQFHKVDPAQHP